MIINTANADNNTGQNQNEASSLYALVFPGQGSQSLGMLAAYQANPAQQQVIEQTYQAASEVLGYDLAKLINEGPVEQLNATEYTQPALLAAGVACWRLWQQANPEQVPPAFMAGHSLGEYTALVCAGVLDFADGIRLVAARGNYMQAAVPDGAGAMAAIVGLTDEQVQQLCQEVSSSNSPVNPANFNSIGQVVIAGATAAVEQAINLAKTTGAKIAKKIPVSVPSHCALMQPAAKRLAQDLEQVKLNKPVIPVINNVDVQCETTEQAIKSALVRQLYCPVQWVKTIEYLAKQQVNTIIECGPGKVLAGLIRRIDKQILTVNLADPAQLVMQ